jgi:hypothetical protein
MVREENIPSIAPVAGRIDRSDKELLDIAIARMRMRNCGVSKRMCVPLQLSSRIEVFLGVTFVEICTHFLLLQEVARGNSSLSEDNSEKSASAVKRSRRIQTRHETRRHTKV